jgi:two-component system chemotaxis sensor kinase CheA
VLDEDEVVVKSLGPVLTAVTGYLGASILDDGTVMLILDSAELLRRAADVSTAARSNTAAEHQTDEAPNVLVVDDQFTVRELQRAILRAAGYRVEVACDGREALQTLTKADFDIVVTDLQMPEMDGLELLGAIRADPSSSGLPVIVVTSRGSEEDRRLGVQAGADAYIVKDEFDQQALLDTVERLVGSR